MLVPEIVENKGAHFVLVSDASKLFISCVLRQEFMRIALDTLFSHPVKYTENRIDYEFIKTLPSAHPKFY